MRWSLPIGRLAGIRVYIHVTFFLLLLWAGWEQYSERHSWADAWLGVFFILIVFGIVVLHELAHAVTARRFGITTRDIVLLPIGGMARMDRMPESPVQELLVALAGPAVNVLLALVFFGLTVLTGHVSQLAQLELGDGGLFAALTQINITLAVFNLVPAFPMDGGRVVRALLAMKLDYARATRIAASIGQSIAVVFAFVGITSMVTGRVGPFSNPVLLLIGLFVWVGAARESSMVQTKARLAGFRVGDLMLTDFRALTPEHTISEALEMVRRSWQDAFPVLDRGYLVGIISRSQLLAGLPVFGAYGLVGQIMNRQFTAVSASASVDQVLSRWRGGQDDTLPVMENGQLVGLLALRHLPEAVAARQMLQ